MTASRVVVVGGGIAGLVFAREVAKGGWPLTLIEAGDRLGGQVARQTVGGIVVDAAAESFATRGGQVAALAQELGLGDDIVTPAEGPAWLHRVDGSSVPLPATSVLGIPGVPLARDVIDVIGTRAALRAQLDLLIPGTRGAKARTLGELVRTRMGAGVLEGLVAPVTRGVHSTHPDQLDLDRASPGLRAALLREGSLSHAVRSLRERAPAGSQVAGIRGGVSRLVDELVADLERFGADLRVGVRATHVERELVRAVDARGDGIELLGHAVVAAPGVPVAPQPGAPAEAAPVAGRRIALVTLLLRAPELDAAPRGTGVLVAEGAPGVTARALTHSTAKWAWLRERAGGRHVLRLSYDALPEDPIATARRDAATLLGVALPEPEEAAVAEWTRATPQRREADGVRFLGEAGAGTGLAAIVGDAAEQAGRFLNGTGD